MHLTTLIVSPAYGRVYTNQAALKAAWESGEDFVNHSGGGRYVSIREVPASVRFLEFRFGKGLNKVVCVERKSS